jgi:ArsR family transcriptional regulator
MEQPMIRDVCDVQSVNQVQVRRVQKQMPDATTLHQVADIFATLGDPTRARIVFALSQSELCVCDLAVLLNMTLSAVSHQLRILRHMGLVKFRKMGRMAYYSLDDEHASELLAQALEHVEHGIQGQVRRVRK